MRMVADWLEYEDASSQFAVISEIASKLGIATEILRRGFVQVELDEGN